MLASRRLLSSSNGSSLVRSRIKVDGVTSCTATSGSTQRTNAIHRMNDGRVFLLTTPGAPQHVRNYKSTFEPSYFSPSTTTAAMEVPAVLEATSSGSSSGSGWSRFFRWYSDKLSTHPLLTKSLTGALIAAAGDVLCQAGTYKGPDKDKSSNKERVAGNNNKANKWQAFWCQGGWDAERSFHFFLLGLTFVAPTSHYWYGGLAKHPWLTGQSFQQITKRVALDQLVWTPVFFVIWLSGFWTLQDKNFDATKTQSQLVQNLPEIMVANWILWIPAQYLNFYACPVKFQVLFTNVIELAWNAYLSFATSGNEHGHGHSHNNKQDNQQQHNVTAVTITTTTTTTEKEDNHDHDTNRGTGSWSGTEGSKLAV